MISHCFCANPPPYSFVSYVVPYISQSDHVLIPLFAYSSTPSFFVCMLLHSIMHISPCTPVGDQLTTSLVEEL